MTWKRAIPRRFAWAAILVLSVAMPACTSSGYPFLTNRNPNRDYSEYVVARPTYGPDTGKPFLLGGYAGANYGPLFPHKRYRVRSWETAFHLPRPIGSARQLRAVEVSCAAGAKDVVKLSIYGLLTSARPQAPDMRPYPNRAIMKWQVQIPLEYFVRRTSVRFWCTLESSPLGGTGWFAGLACIRTYRGPHGSVCFRN